MRLTVLAAALILSACASQSTNGLTAADNQVIKSIHAKTLENWGAMPYIDSAPRSATTTILLNPDGSIGDLRISKSSGNTNFDNGLLIAIRRAAPFKVPAANQGKPMQYELVFTK